MAASSSRLVSGSTATDLDIIPSTPPSIMTKEESSPVDESSQADNAGFTSPARLSSSMTPPPSAQPPPGRTQTSKAHTLRDDISMASPPPTARYTFGAKLPSSDEISIAGIEELKTMATDLVQALNEARTSAAHFKLQHTLLTMESHEAAERAEIEHQMTRREVEILQLADHKRRTSLPGSVRLPQNSAQAQLDNMSRTCKELEDERDELERLLKKAKRLVDEEKDHSELLMEENSLLKTRIRENRAHFNKVKNLSPIFKATLEAMSTSPRKAAPQWLDGTPSHAPFAALLAADQVLSSEAASVPSTPNRSQVSRLRAGHVRGAHSLSSLPNTPARGRPFTADGFLPLSAPGSQLVNESAERERYDRDSTISVSDDEAISDGEDLRGVPQSQASSLATNMLRKHPGSQESLRLSQNATQSSSVLQTKIFGPVKKPGASRSTRKRVADTGDNDIASKKAKLAEGVGLGIGSWSPRS